MPTEKVRGLFAGSLIVSLTTALLMLSGCSTFNPHQLSIEPLHPSVNQQISLPAELEVEVISKDMRSSALIGFRISRLSDRAEVNLPLPATQALTDGAKVALVKLGATPTLSADTKLTIILEELEYAATQKALQSVQLSASIKVTADKYDQQYSGNYQTDKEYQFATTPSLKDNQEIVNEVILMSISRAFNDPQLINFLQQP
ncbi:YajG family lipoprotein [Amphritea balenae]|uniref:YajG family lipoprotein n=1 Tax=Amphritea balenae TaxID=452629 RepID=UPI0014755F68|nr:YajG family lipoprotein [Amphritea balenae]